MYDVLSIGELLVDLLAVQQGSMSAAGEMLFSRQAGGAPANVAAASALLGPGKVGFVGRVGDDPFGRFLQAALSGYGVDTAWLTLSTEVQTPIAIAGRAEGSQEVEFSFYGPDEGKRLALVTPDDLPSEQIAGSRVTVAGGVALSHPVSAESVFRAAELAGQGGALFAFDPNWRPALWPEPGAWKDAVAALLPLVDVLKISRTEMALLGGVGDLAGAGAELARMSAPGRRPGRPLLLAVTLGAHGSAYALYSPSEESPERLAGGTVEPIQVDVVDPTGAGDAYLAGLICGLLDARSPGADGRVDLSSMSAGALHGAVLFANATGALTTTRRGAMTGLPTRADVERVLSR